METVETEIVLLEKFGNLVKDEFGEYCGALANLHPYISQMESRFHKEYVREVKSAYNFINDNFELKTSWKTTVTSYEKFEYQE